MVFSVPAAAFAGDRPPWIDAALLGIVEGLTELLPVSSTGHLVLLDAALGRHGEAAKTFDIVIQLGAVLAVVVYFRSRLLRIAVGVAHRREEDLRLFGAIAIAFVPAAVVGLLLHRPIKDLLFGPVPVAGALIVGGAAMIVVDRWLRSRPRPACDGLAHVTARRGVIVGLFQCLALWPGASRSMTTIVGGQLSGLSTATAAELSFLLAIPTLGAATLFDLATGWRTLIDAPGGAAALAVGLVVSFVVALAVVAGFLRYLRRYGLVPFGVYRIVLGAVVLLIALR